MAKAAFRCISYRIGGVLLPLLLAWACTVGPSSKATSNGRAANKKACLAIVDGQATDTYPATVALVIPKRSADAAFINCTGTFIGDNILITAAHCIPASGPADFVVATNAQTVGSSSDSFRGGIAATAFYYDDRRKVDEDGMLDDASMPRSTDVALVQFPDYTSSHWSIVATKAMPPGTPVSLVGYGRTDLDGLPTVGRSKRVGVNTIAAPNDQFQADGLYQIVGWAHAGEAAQHGQNTSLGAQGDSGGPLMVKNTLIGVDVSGISDLKQPNLKSLIGTTGIDFYVDVTNATVKSLMAKASSAGAHITTADTVSAAKNTDSTTAVRSVSGGLSQNASCE